VAVLIGMIVSTLLDLRRLLWVQASSVAVLTIASIVVHPASPAGGTIRLWGLGGVFSNPNDFAINIAINFPLCLAFFLGAKGLLRKLTWAVALMFLLYGVIATYSRSGLIAMVICSVICVWEFGIRGKRPMVVVASIAVMLVGVGVAITTPRYVLRLSTLLSGEDAAGSMDHGSLDARRELLMESISVTLHHPLFGVGPGNFQAYTQSWHVTHNTYTELSSEAGIPALALFLTVLVLTFRNLSSVRKTASYRTNPQMQLFTNALRAGTAAYMVGAAFASSAYTLFPYFMVAYASALYKIASSEQAQDMQPVGTSLNSRNTQNPYGKQEQHALAGAR
jgi:O-antigen ligase